MKFLNKNNISGFKNSKKCSLEHKEFRYFKNAYRYKFIIFNLYLLEIV